MGSGFTANIDSELVADLILTDFCYLSETESFVSVIQGWLTFLLSRFSPHLRNWAFQLMSLPQVRLASHWHWTLPSYGVENLSSRFSFHLLTTCDWNNPLYLFWWNLHCCWSFMNMAQQAWTVVFLDWISPAALRFFTFLNEAIIMFRSGCRISFERIILYNWSSHTENRGEDNIPLVWLLNFQTVETD